MQGNLLVVDDDLDAAQLLAELLVSRGHTVEVATSAEAALLRIADHAFDVVITDVQMGAVSGLELCQRIRSRFPDLLTIILTGHDTLDMAIQAIRAGAYDFVSKPIVIDVLVVALERALEHRALRLEVRKLRRTADAGPIASILGSSAAVHALTELIDQVADSDATVLITGESGTGKELVARAIHARSSRKDQPFVAINCAAMPAALLESELFGHVKGAFTDASRNRPGLVLQAGGGVLFLDEIGEMPLEMQAKLLRVLQERMVRPVGGDVEVPFAARLVTATNRDLELEVRERRFREDLFYRVNVVQVSVPALRDRQGDVLVLAHAFLHRIAARTGKAIDGLSPETARRLIDYDWPGNVRELENCIERAVALARTSELAVESLPDKIRLHRATRLTVDEDGPLDVLTLDEMARRYVQRVLTACGGNKTHAAKLLGIDRRSLYRRLAEPSTAPARATDESPAPSRG